MKYILLLDKEPEILEILQESLESMTSLPLKTASSSAEGIQTLEKEGSPDLIIVHCKLPENNALVLYQYLQTHAPDIPFILLAEEGTAEVRKQFSKALGVISRGSYIKGLKNYINRLFPLGEDQVEYLKIPVGFFLSLSSMNFDTYLRLSESNFVKIYSKHHVFDDNDLQKLKGKFLNHLFILRQDALSMGEEFDQFMEARISSQSKDALKSAMGIIRKNFEEHLDKKIKSIPQQNNLDCAMDVLETTLAFSKALGWDEDNVRLTRKTVDQTIKILTQDLKLTDILSRQQQDNFYSKHVSLLSLLLCVVAQGIGWTSESTQQKLIMAALMHDYFVEDAFYEDNSNLSGRGDYQLHPIKIAELARSIKGLPSDVDQILLQHHERPDGSGFPRGLTASHISPLSAIFIVCEELIHFTRGQEITPTLLNNFWQKNEIFTQKEPFKKISLSMKSKG